MRLWKIMLRSQCSSRIISSSASSAFSFRALSAYFSSSSYSSTCSYSSRSREEWSKNVRVSVWWDFENCNIPAGTNVFNVAKLITAAVRANGITGPVQITAYGDIFLIPRDKQIALSLTGVNMSHVPRGGKNSADRSLIVDLMYWVSQNPPPAHLFLISGDCDFAYILHRLRMSNYNILLACNNGKSTPLCTAASIMWNWQSLMKEENLSGRHFNNPPDGPHGSWYGTYKVPHENSFMNDDQAHDELSDECSDVRDAPLTVLNKISQLLSLHPRGIPLPELRAQMLTQNTGIAKDYYGYKKFSLFLNSIPHIVKLKPTVDGYIALPVTKKSHAFRKTTRNGGDKDSEYTDEKNDSFNLSGAISGKEKHIPVEITNPGKDESEKEKETETVVKLLKNELKFVGEGMCDSQAVTASNNIATSATPQSLVSIMNSYSMFKDPNRKAYPTKNSNNENSLNEMSASDILLDCKNLTSELLATHPEGFNMGQFRKWFKEKYDYDLDIEKLECKKMASLFKMMPNVRAESMMVFPSIEEKCITDEELPENDAAWEELGPVNDGVEYEPSAVNDSSSDSESETETEAGNLRSREKVSGSDHNLEKHHSSLLQILDSWCDSDDYSEKNSGHAVPKKQYSLVATSGEDSQDNVVGEILGGLNKSMKSANFS